MCHSLVWNIYKANATYVKIRNTQSSVGGVLQVFHLSNCHFYLSHTIGQVKFRTLLWLAEHILSSLQASRKRALVKVLLYSCRSRAADACIYFSQHSISQPPVQPCFARVIELIAHPKITVILSFLWGSIFIKSGILHTLKFHLHTPSCHFWLNLCFTVSASKLH